MKNNILALSSLSMDLKRVALGLHNGSLDVAERFTKEAIQRKNETNISILPLYLREILNNLEVSLSVSDMGKRSEDALMYSTLIQNYTLASIQRDI
jgi:hypothetical protein